MLFSSPRLCVLTLEHWCCRAASEPSCALLSRVFLKSAFMQCDRVVGRLGLAGRTLFFVCLPLACRSISTPLILPHVQRRSHMYQWPQAAWELPG